MGVKVATDYECSGRDWKRDDMSARLVLWEGDVDGADGYRLRVEFRNSYF